MTTEQIFAALVQISERIDAAFAEDADRYTADKHATLEQVGDEITDLMTGIQEAPLMTARSLTAERPGPVLVAVSVPAGVVNVTTDPEVTTAAVYVRATTDDPALSEAIERAELRWDAMGALMVTVPDLPSIQSTVRGGSINVVQHIGHVAAGTVVTGLVIDGDLSVSSGRITVNGVPIHGSTIVTGQIEVIARVPEGSNVDLRTTSADLTAQGEFDTVMAHTVSADVRADACHQLVAFTTSGDVSAAVVDTAATIQTVSGDIRLAEFAGRADLSSTSGDITVRACHAADGSARSVSGDVRVTATGRALVAGVSIQARSVSGVVATPATVTARPAVRRSGRVGGDWS
jgi:hypothetical protein